VQFFDGPSLLGSAALSPSSLLTSIATLNASSVPADLRAVYSGDANFHVSSSTNAVQTGTGSVSLSVTSSSNPSVFAEPVILKIAVAPSAAGAPVPTGSVAVSLLGLFSLGTVALDATGQGSLAVPLSSTQATSIPWGFPAGANSVALTYSGDTNYAGAQTTFTQSVNKADTAIATSTTVGFSSVTVRATVSDNDSGVTSIGFALPGGNAGSTNPTGGVQFLELGPLGPQVRSANSCSSP